MATDDIRDRLVQAVWKEVRAFTPATAANYPAAHRAVAAGASAEDVVTAMTAAAYQVAFRLLFVLSCEHVEEGNYDADLGWALVEASLADDRAMPKDSHALDCLHEDLLSNDPTGREGQDLFT